MALRQLVRRLVGRPATTPTFSAPPGVRIYAVGDIHGRADLLAPLLDEIAADARSAPGRVEEVFLGDYVDRGDGSRAVIDLLLAPPPAGHVRKFLRGNHEDMLEAFLHGPDILPAWAQNGAVQTLASYGVHATLSANPRSTCAQFTAAFPPEHRRFLAGLALTHRAGDYLFVHAGIRPGVPLEAQHPADLTTIRREFLEHPGPLPVRVVHGHTPRREPEVTPWRVGIDTGAFATGRLTCAVIEGTELRFLAATR